MVIIVGSLFVDADFQVVEGEDVGTMGGFLGIHTLESTMLILAIERSGIAVASKQATIDMIAASIIAMTETATSCKESVCAAPTKILQI